MNKIETIRQEIERRIKVYRTKSGFPAGTIGAAKIGTYQGLIEFIDSLTDETKDAEQAAARYERENRQSVLSSVDIVNAFIEGARWQSDRRPVTEATATRPTAAERVAKVRADLERHGFDPFADKSRRMKTVAMRHCVFLMLRREGYTQKELGDATGYDHSTVSWGEANARALVNLGDSLYTKVWNQINMIDEKII